jgi:hypothetical protein
MELYTKWWPLLKQENKDRACPKPKDEILKNLKVTENSKRKKNAQKKAEAPPKQQKPTSSELLSAELQKTDAKSQYHRKFQ